MRSESQPFCQVVDTVSQGATGAGISG
jgi:hypothetical protein